jgi:hypothetical protein
MRILIVFAGIVAVLAAAALVGLSSRASAAPIAAHFHDSFSDSNPNANQCGIDGSSVSRVVINEQDYADGTGKVEVTFDYVFTSGSTGKSIEIFGASQQSGTATENGDGTISFVSTFKGLPQKLKLPNGQTLSRDGGYVTITQTYDEATGDLVSQVISPNHGPHPSLADPSLFCDVIVPALS